MREIRVLGLYIEDRITEAADVQKVLTKYGCSIKTRLGLHEADEETCSRNGLVLLELAGEAGEWDKFEKELSAVKGIKLQKMSFK